MLKQVQHDGVGKAMEGKKSPKISARTQHQAWPVKQDRVSPDQ